jgi:hypothetical protein
MPGVVTDAPLPNAVVLLQGYIASVAHTCISPSCSIPPPTHTHTHTHTARLCSAVLWRCKFATHKLIKTNPVFCQPIYLPQNFQYYQENGYGAGITCSSDPLYNAPYYDGVHNIILRSGTNGGGAANMRFNQWENLEIPTNEGRSVSVSRHGESLLLPPASLLPRHTSLSRSRHRPFIDALSPFRVVVSHCWPLLLPRVSPPPCHTHSAFTGSSTPTLIDALLLRVASHRVTVALCYYHSTPSVPIPAPSPLSLSTVHHSQRRHS